MPSPARVLILFAHPALQRSRVNGPLVAAVRGLEGVTFNDLYEEYPDFLIDADREQALLRAHDLIVFHHPFYWYSSPAILKEWQDIVLEYGFAYGESGTALRGKRWLSVITAGGPQEAYQPEGFNRFTIRQLLTPFEQTAQLCGMTFLDPFIVHGTHALSKAEIATHAADYRRLIAALRDGQSRDDATKFPDA
jgi:glutathione-regulated potassium-efflux system ancillary protein KefG